MHITEKETKIIPQCPLGRKIDNELIEKYIRQNVLESIEETTTITIKTVYHIAIKEFED